MLRPQPQHPGTGSPDTLASRPRTDTPCQRLSGGSAQPSRWAATADVPLLSIALAYTVFFCLLAIAGVTNTALVSLLVPISAALVGSAFLGASLSVC